MSTLTADEARRRFAGARVARLGTIDVEERRPHLVPVVFAVRGDVVFSAVDGKPKRTTALRRLANVAAEPGVSLLADHYADDDWDALWWARADGEARILAPADPLAVTAVGLLAQKYAQHAATPPTGPVLAVEVRRWSGWAAR
jgi:PPOX class probable F420-dependent enzyme